MRFKNLNLLILTLTLFLFSCQREIENDLTSPVPGNVINPAPVNGDLAGKVIDENNAAVTGATVRAGSNTTTTDNRGLFSFTNIQMDKFASMVTVEKPGYFKGIRTFSASAGSTSFVKLKLIPKTLTGNIDAIAGGSVNLPDNSRITINANSVVVKATNQAYTGSIKVFAAVIDPTANDIAEIIPGSFQANDANNNRVLLVSYGMLAVELEGNSGEQLQIASGKTAKLRFTIPASLRSSAVATIPLWSVDESNGLWKQEGSATKTNDYYEGDVSHFSFWNCDINIPTVYLELTVVTSEGPLPFTKVKITRVNSGGASYGITSSTGHVRGLVPKNEPLLLEIMNTCNQVVYTQNIGALNSNTDLGSITVSPGIQYSVLISGSAVNCSNQPVTNGHALIYFEGHLYTRAITNGSFSATITRCSNNSANVEVVVVDNTASQQSITWTSTATTGAINTGVLNACGISTNSYINYTLDGINFSINTGTVGDSITTYGNAGSTQNFTNISGIRVGQPGIKISVSTNGGAVGSFPLQEFIVNQYIAITLVTPFNITFTSYAAPGQFIEGNFTGQFRETANNNLHNISASFRVRRR